MSKVFVINKGPHDYSPAEKYGELVYLTEGPVDKFDLYENKRRIQAILLFFNSDDYILLTGLASLHFITGFVLGCTGYERVKVLVYQDGQYIEKEV